MWSYSIELVDGYGFVWIMSTPKRNTIEHSRSGGRAGVVVIVDEVPGSRRAQVHLGG
jgi:hypothetical protein